MDAAAAGAEDLVAELLDLSDELDLSEEPDVAELDLSEELDVSDELEDEESEVLELGLFAEFLAASRLSLR